MSGREFVLPKGLEQGGWNGPYILVVLEYLEPLYLFSVLVEALLDGLSQRSTWWTSFDLRERPSRPLALGKARHGHKEHSKDRIPLLVLRR